MPRTPIAASTTANADYFGAGYLALYRDHLIPPEQTAAECDFLLRELAPRAGDRWLDIPCGYGRHTIELRRRAPWLRLVGGGPQPHVSARGAERRPSRAGPL